MSDIKNLLSVAKGGLTLLAAVGGAAGIAKLIRGSAASSWTDVSKALRVEPVTLVDERCLYLPYLRDVLYTATATTAAYYLQAVAVQGTVGKLDVVKTLDGLNPKRDTISNAAFLIGDAASFAMDSHTPRLPMFNTDALQAELNKDYKRVQTALEKHRAVSTEAMPSGGIPTPPSTTAALIEATGNVAERVAADYTGNVDDKALKAATDIANLSVGAMISVELADGNEKRKVPVVVRLIVSAIRPNILSNIFAEASRNRTSKERYHAWRAGQISFVKDMILCQDIIDADIKNRIEDTSGAWKEMKERQSTNRLNTVLSLGMRPSIATASNVYIVSRETLMECENAMGGKISNGAVRQKIFNNTMMMILYVIDTKRETVEIWHRGQGTPDIKSIKEMKMNGSERNATIELQEAFKAYTGTGF